MNNMLPPPTIKHHGDRVRLPKHPASYPNTKFWYGTVRYGRVEWDDPNDLPDHYSPDAAVNGEYPHLQDA